MYPLNKNGADVDSINVKDKEKLGTTRVVLVELDLAEDGFLKDGIPIDAEAAKILDYVVALDGPSKGNLISTKEEDEPNPLIIVIAA